MEEMVTQTLSLFGVIYQWLRRVCAPLAKWIFPRHIPYTKVVLFTPNRLTIGRTMAMVPFTALLWFGYPTEAFWLYTVAAIFDFIDGLLAMVHKKLGHQDDPKLGAFLDAFCDKIQWSVATIATLLLANYSGAKTYQILIIAVEAAILLYLEGKLGVVRWQDYQYEKGRADEERQLKAGYSGKLKFALEMIGLGALVLGQTHPRPFEHWSFWVAWPCLLLAMPFAYKSLQGKLEARRRVEKNRGD